MRSLARVAMEGMESSIPLAAPFKKFEQAEARFYRGALSLVAGPPGSGKTITALNIVNNLRVPTLYISNDSTRYTITKRSFSMLTGMDQMMASGVIERSPHQASQVLRQWSSVRFDFSSNPDMMEIARHGEAFRELYGEYPHLTVVDILMNVEHEGVAEQNYWRLMPALKDVAREQNTAMVGIHHTSESVKGEPCPPRSAIMGKANQLPELIITQIMQNGKMLYAVVKNRNGKDDLSGQTFFTLPVDASRCQIEDVMDDDGILFRDGTNVPSFEKVNPQTLEDF